jgi:glycosidase
MPTKQDFAEAKTKMVRKLLSMGYDYFRIPAVVAGGKRWKVCMDKLDEWFIHGNHAPYQLRKPVSSFTHDQLTVAVTLFTKVHSDFLKKI